MFTNRLLSVQILLTLTVMLVSCKKEQNIPTPTEDTVIHKNGEDGDSYTLRMKWIELMHGGEHSGWRNIEASNQESSYQNWLKNEDHSLRSVDENLADGNILGRWSEKGSNNNAGNIMAVDYDPETDIVYAVGGGGPVFKGELFENNWSVVNDKIRFSTNLLKVFTLTDGTKRIVSAVNGIPHYSDDGGKLWKPSTGVIATTDGTIYDSQVTKEDIIYFLGKKDYWSDIHLYVSIDKGISYKSAKNFNTNDTRNIALAQDAITGNIYIIEQTKATETVVYRITKSSPLNQISINTDFGYGENGRANLQAVTYQDSVHLYSFGENNRLYLSKNFGNSWKGISTLPESPWDVGLYVFPSSPKNMLFGAVDAFKSQNGGIGWSRVNEWWEYYGDIYTKLHADMMTFKEFKNKSGKPFLLNGNHGGLYYSEDYGRTNSNIGLFNLNVSQYYDVRTYPADPYFIFAGSQDQGQQRGYLSDDETTELAQNISGDYGHIEFTGNGKSLWSVYPGGTIGFYSDPKFQNSPIASYEINSKNETVWISPIMPGPDPSKDQIIAAGGSTIESSFGSYLIQLDYINQEIVPTQLPFDFSVSGGQISAMAIDPLNKAVWYVATTNGYFYKSTNSGQSFTRTATMLSESHYLYGSCILPSSKNKDVVYLSGNGYNFKPVYKSTDGGKTFKSFSNGLPSTMVFNIVANEDETLLFAATEAGPYVYIVEKQKWYSLHGTYTPNQTYWSVEYVPQTNIARFATYGRGIWDIEVKAILSGVDTDYSNEQPALHIMPNPAHDYFYLTGDENEKWGPMSILDINGKVVKTAIAFPFMPVQIGDLQTGTYIVQINIKGKKHSKKLIKI